MSPEKTSHRWPRVGAWAKEKGCRYYGISRWLCAIVAVGFFALVLHERAGAQEIKLVSPPSDDPLEIKGVLDEGTNTFRRSVLLRAEGGDVEEVRWRMDGDLINDDDPDLIIDPSNVTITGGTRLEENEDRNVLVTVSGVEKPGIYNGTLLFYPRGQPNNTTQLPVRLTVSARPEVVPTPEATSFQLTRWAPIALFLACSTSGRSCPGG